MLLHNIVSFLIMKARFFEQEKEDLNDTQKQQSQTYQNVLQFQVFQ